MKALKKWSIATLVFCVLALVLSTVCVFRPEGFGLWLVTTYEDITCELGHSVAGVYNKLTIISYALFLIFFVVNQILLFTYASKCKKLVTEGATTTTETTTVVEKKIILVPEKKKRKHEKRKKDSEVEESPEEKPEIRVPAPSGADLADFLEKFRNKK